MKDKICKNCGYFEESLDYKAKDDRHNCNCPNFVYTGNNDNGYPLGNKLGYWDYESFSAGFEVGSNFGCIHFKGDN